MIKEIVKTIGDFLRENDHPDIRDNFDDVLAGIQLLQDEKEVSNVEEIINNSKAVMKGQMEMILDSQLTKEYLIFVVSLSKLLYNFNINTVNDPDLSLFCKFINKTADLIEFSKVVIDIEKKANILIQQWKNFNPPALSISKALLEEVLKDE